MMDNITHEIICEELRFCGCIDHESVIALLSAYLRSDRTEKATVDIVKHNSLGAAYFLMATLDKMEYTEHGTAIRGAWLTERGEQLLKGIQALEQAGGGESQHRESPEGGEK